MGRLTFLAALLAILQCGTSYANEERKTLWRLDIEGNQSIRTGELEDAIASTESSHIPVLGRLMGGIREFDPIAFQTDVKRIEHLYRRRGYYQAKVDRADVTPCSSSGRVCVKLFITEGKPTSVSSVKIVLGQSTPPQAEEGLAAVFGLKAGDLFDHDRYERGKATLERNLKERSYPLPAVKGEALYDEAVNKVAVTLRVTPGTAARIGPIRFEGLDEIRAEDAMRRLPIKTGGWYNPLNFEDAESFLGDLDVFRTIAVELKPRPGAPEIVDVIYRVREKPLKTLQAGAGLRLDNSRQEARLHGEWTNRNYHENLRKFTITGEPRYAVVPSIFDPVDSGPLGTFEISMLHPAFFGARQDLRTSIGFESELEQGYRWYGPRVNGDIEHRMSRRVTIAGGYSFRYLTFYNVRLSPGAARGPANPATVPAELLLTPDYRLAFFSQRFTWDNRDQPLAPHVGAYLQLGIEESARMFGSAFTYFRLMPEIRTYTPTTRRGTLAARLGYGKLLSFGGSLGGDSNSPITERFYAGGSNSHRGFGYRRLSPAFRAADGTLVPIGGNSLLFFSLEERVNLFHLFGQWLIGAVFLDAGDVVPGSELGLKNLHYAVGPGLRYSTPLGIIRADVGFRVNRLDGETDGRANPDPGQRYAIHVSFGESF